MKEVRDFQEELRSEKCKLHMKYIFGISVIINALVIVSACYSNNKFVEQVSFAGTIASIILSVIAIIMTLIGESKSENTKDKLINLSEGLEDVVHRIEKTTNNLEGVVKSNSEVKRQLNSLGDAIQSAQLSQQEAAVTHIKGGEKENSKNRYIVIFNEISRNFSYIIFKDLCITLLYIGAEKLIGNTEVEYEQYLTQIDNLNLNIVDPHLAWNLSFVFLNATWNYSDNEFMSYVHQYCRNKYYNEVSSIGSYIESFKDKTEDNS